MTGGVTRLVYRGVRGAFRLTGKGIGGATALLGASAGDAPASRGRAAALAALNGVVGDHLASTGNPLALTMRFRRDGRPLTLDKDSLAAAFPEATGKLAVLAHGLCVSDLQWTRQNHDHGAALAHDLGYTPGLPLLQFGPPHLDERARLRRGAGGARRRMAHEN